MPNGTGECKETHVDRVEHNDEVIDDNVDIEGRGRRKEQIDPDSNSDDRDDNDFGDNTDDDSKNNNVNVATSLLT